MITANRFLFVGCVVGAAVLLLGLFLLGVAWLNDRWRRRAANRPQSPT